MKSFIVFSDVHGDYKAMQKLRPLICENDGAFFAGDGLSCVLQSNIEKLYWVAGNCDGYGDKELIAEIDGVKILLTHGHLYGVKSGLQRLFYRAKELDVNAVIFGHTHAPLIALEDGVLFLNPGTCSSNALKPTFIYLCINDGKITPFLNDSTLSNSY